MAEAAIEDRTLQIALLYKQGLPYRVIGERIGISGARVQQILQHYILHLSDSGQTQAQIAIDIGMSTKHVGVIINKRAKQSGAFVRIPKEMLEQIDAQGVITGRTRSETIREAIRRYLYEGGKDEPSEVQQCASGHGCRCSL